MNAQTMKRAIIVMGVSGCGKSSVGRAITEILGGEFLEADDLHPADNIKKMAGGIPLQDEDRWPWLDTVVDVTNHKLEQFDHCVIACSALKKKYRDRLRNVQAEVYFVFLEGDRHLILSRMEARKDHFMPPKLLDSQFEALEVPTDEQNVIAVPITGTTSDISSSATTLLNRLFSDTDRNSL